MSIPTEFWHPGSVQQIKYHQLITFVILLCIHQREAFVCILDGTNKILVKHANPDSTSVGLFEQNSTGYI